MPFPKRTGRKPPISAVRLANGDVRCQATRLFRPMTAIGAKRISSTLHRTALHTMRSSATARCWNCGIAADPACGISRYLHSGQSGRQGEVARQPDLKTRGRDSITRPEKGRPCAEYRSSSARDHVQPRSSHLPQVQSRRTKSCLGGTELLDSIHCHGSVMATGIELMPHHDVLVISFSKARPSICEGFCLAINARDGDVDFFTVRFDLIVEEADRHLLAQQD